MGQQQQQLDELLREFLEADAQRRAKGVTLETIHAAMKKLANDRLEDRQRIDGNTRRLDRHGRRLDSLEEEVERLSAAAEGPDWSPARENTGNFDLAVLKREHEERLDDAKWKRRQFVTVVVGIAAALVVASITGCVSYAFTRAMASSPAPAIGGK